MPDRNHCALSDAVVEQQRSVITTKRYFSGHRMFEPAQVGSRVEYGTNANDTVMEVNRAT